MLWVENCVNHIMAGEKTSSNKLNKTLIEVSRILNEQDNLSVYKDDNPVLMRIILEKWM